MRRIVLILLPILLFSCTKPTKFQLLSSKETGITFNNIVTETDSFNIMKYEYIYNGAGLGIADLNNDGLQDIIFAANQVSPRVYLNLGNFKFRDITANFAGLTNNQWYSAVSVVDINSDGWKDVYLSSTANKDPEKRKNRLWINNGSKDGGDPVFTELAEKYGIADTGYCENSTFFDYDRDGLLDLYVLNNTVNSRMNTNYRAKILDGSAPNNDRLYHNNGNGTFTDVTKQAGIVYEGFGLGLALGDVNKDGFPDIYVSNDFISNDLLYINQGDGTFRNEIKKYMSYQSRSSMGNDMADVNNDGNPDMYTMDMLPQNYYKRKQTIGGFSYNFYKMDEQYGFEHQYVRNMLHLHNGFMNGEMLPYSEVGQMMGVAQTDWSWSPLFADYDNDGKKDLIVTNGFPKDETDKDWTRFKVTAAGFYASDKLLMDMAPAVKIPNLAFENKGDIGFIKKTDWLPPVPSYSYGAAFVDLDNDGDLDYVVNNLDDEAFIYKNTTVEKAKKKSNYIRIKLTGKIGNIMAIGAKIELWDKSNYQFMENFLTRGYSSSVDPVIHFGLSDSKVIDSIKITWPTTGNKTVLKNVNVNETLEINEDSSIPSATADKSLHKNELLFSTGENILNYVHQQTDYVDFDLKQILIPHKYSQIGPRMVQGDLNNDGKEDLIIGSTNLLPTTVFLRKGNKFEETVFEGLTTKKEFSESDLAILDIDNDGDNDVIAIAGGYENKEETEYRHYLYENQNGIFVRKDLPISSFSASVVRPCDYNHDGYIDLFIGSRIKREMFPYATHSWLLKNEKGKFSADNVSKLNLGMVTDAIWTDYDNDGWEDLLVVREYNSVALLKNMNGKELVPQDIPEIESKHGIWYSIAAGDFNKDGYTDYIVGNLGENNMYKTSEKYPLTVYAIDFDGDGTIDPLMTAFWPDPYGKMREYPVHYLDELWSQSKYFGKFKDYSSFSYANIGDIMDENELKKLEFKLDVNSTSSYILWNVKGKFRWERLPLSLQVSPIRKMIVQDLNGDTYPDIIVGGNDYTYAVPTGYYDANKGFVLINKGEKRKNDEFQFDVLTPAGSGMLLKGMVESLLYFKGDTSLVVAGINREKTSVFKLVPNRK
jgi:hypothetical protein